MIRYYRAIILTLIIAFAIVSWHFGLHKPGSAMYIADRFIPLGICLSWTFFLGALVLAFDVLTTSVYKIHHRMCPIRTITLFILSVAWAGHIMISPNKLLIIAPCSVVSLCCLGLAIADGIRKNKRMCGDYNG